jgi:hypothetical protein
MNVEIARTQRQILDLYEKQRSYLAGKPRQYVEDLKHQAMDLIHHEDFSVRTAAEINRTACVMVLESRP